MKILEIFNVLRKRKPLKLSNILTVVSKSDAKTLIKWFGKLPKGFIINKLIRPIYKKHKD